MVTATYFVSLCWCLSTLSAVSVSRKTDGRGPPQIDRDSAMGVVVVNLGEKVRLTCPVRSGSPVLVEWSKDGESIDETWPGFRFGSRTLKVKSATADLSGTYRCKGITGYGAVEHEIKLVVIDPSDERFSVKTVGVPSSNEYPSLRPFISAPRITQRYPQPRIRKMAGGGMRLRCLATGIPRPTVQWYKDGVDLAAGSRPAKVDLSVAGQLTVTQLTPSDSGTYQCRVTNILGQDTAQFHLIVDEPFGQKPEIVGSDPQNTTVSAGDQVSLQCRVNGQSPMHLKWLKRIEPHDTKAPRNATVAIEMLNGDRYQVLNVSDMVRSRPDEFLIKLTLSSARPSESGQYVCLAANNGGLTIRKAYLIVKDPGGAWFLSRSGDSVYLMLFIPVLIVTVLVTVAICCLCRHGISEKTPSETRSEAEDALMGTKPGSNRESPVAGPAPDLTLMMSPSGGDLFSCRSPSCHGRRYEPPSQWLPSGDPPYSVASFDPPSSTGSERSGHSSCRSCCNCGQPLPGNPPSLRSHGQRHKHFHYVC